MEIVLYPPTINYYLSYQRPQQLFKALNKIGYRIIFCNYNPEDRTGYFNEIFQDFFVCSKINPYKMSKLDKMPILWITYPPFASYLDQYPNKLLIFDAIDEPSDEFESWQNGLDILRRKSDIIFATSKKLYNDNKLYKDNVFLCPNGTDYDYFSRAENIFSDKPYDMPRDNKITVGYFGAIATWVNWAFVYNTALCNPDINFIFIGPLFNMSRFPIRLSNVYYLGKKPYDKLVNYLQYFDICFIPFKVTNMINGCNPIKMYEYLSAGKIVVATDFAEAAGCEFINIIKSKDYILFGKIVKKLLDENNEDIKMKRKEFAKNNSWDERAKVVDEVIKKYLNKI
ncbi:MAG: hypothetical protein N2448_09965 [Caloramator sp.]|nr:hypothetical protein [Caloramator sp.]